MPSCRAPRYFDKVLIEHHDGADRLAAAQGRKAVVDGGERDALSDQLVEQQAAVEIGLRQHRKIAPWPGAAVARAADALFLHQRAPAEGDVLLDVDLAEPDDLAAGPHRFGAEAERGAAAGRLHDGVGAPAGGLALRDRDPGFAPRVQSTAA